MLVLAVASCREMKESDPYEGFLNVLTINAVFPEGFEDVGRKGFEAVVEDINNGSRYTAVTDEAGSVSFRISNGLYRVNVSGKSESDVFNGASDKVVVSGSDVALPLLMTHSKAGSIIIKEIYCGGCKKLPQEGDYQLDQYFILHNNDYQIHYLDSLCFGALCPDNAHGTNQFVTKDPQTGESIFPDFLPVGQAVWQFPGDGDDFPLQPGEDAVVCLRAAIDHTLQYPLSVNLNRPEYFACYNITLFPDPRFQPAPGDLISPDRYLNPIIKMSKAKGYYISINSPALVVWKSKGISMQEFVNDPDNLTPVPGNSAYGDVVKVPYEWVVDAVEVFNGASTGNAKRLAPSADAGYVFQTDTFLGHSLMRHKDLENSEKSGYEVLVDTNNSMNDFYETEKQSLHE